MTMFSPDHTLRPWIDTRLNEEEMNFLRDAIENSTKENMNKELAGNIYKSELIEDKDNWFYETVLKKLTEKMFCRNWDVYYKYHIEGDESQLPEFGLNKFWVNYQKQHEFNPLHNHNGLYSFVVFVEIPTHWKEQYALPISANSFSPSASDFVFAWSEKDTEECYLDHIPLCSQDEGRLLFFPAFLRHAVYPFYECEKNRVTISGNIIYENTFSHTQESLKKEHIVNLKPDEIEEKEKILKMLELNAEIIRIELGKQDQQRKMIVKKVGEKGGLN